MLAQRRTLKILLALLSLVASARVCAWAQGGSISGQVISPAGYPVAAASVRVCPPTSTGNPCSPLSNLFQDPALTIPVGNPYTTDGFGNYSVFAAAANYYIVQISFTSNLQPYTYSYVVAAASSAVAVAAPQYALATYTAAGTATTIGSSYVNPTYGPIQTDASADLLVPGSGTFHGNLTAPVFNATGSPYYEVNGTQIAAANLSNGVTGTGAVVLANTPTMITPNIGAATGTSLSVTGLVNATSGYQYAAAAPLNHLLLGNGTDYVDSASLPASAISSLYYQTAAANGTAQTQRPTLNFATRFALADSTSPAETTVDLASTISAGSCTFCGLTYDGYGRITAASSGNPGTGNTANPIWYAAPTGLILQAGNSTYTGSSVTVTFPHNFTSTNVAVVLTSQYASGTYGVARPQVVYGTQTTSSFQWTSDENPTYITWEAIGW